MILECILQNTNLPWDHFVELSCLYQVCARRFWLTCWALPLAPSSHSRPSKGSWLPNSTVLHLDIYLGIYKSKKHSRAICQRWSTGGSPPQGSSAALHLVWAHSCISCSGIVFLLLYVMVDIPCVKYFFMAGFTSLLHSRGFNLGRKSYFWVEVDFFVCYCLFNTIKEKSFWITCCQSLQKETFGNQSKATASTTTRRPGGKSEV